MSLKPKHLPAAHHMFCVCSQACRQKRNRAAGKRQNYTFCLFIHFKQYLFSSETSCTNKDQVCWNMTRSNQVHPIRTTLNTFFWKIARLQFSRLLLTVVMDRFLLTALTATLQQGFFMRCPETRSTLTWHNCWFKDFRGPLNTPLDYFGFCDFLTYNLDLREHLWWQDHVGRWKFCLQSPSGKQHKTLLWSDKLLTDNKKGNTRLMDNRLAQR